MEKEIERLDYFGRGITYIDNKICFVYNALPKEIVDVEVIKNTNKYLEGKVINYIEESPDRVESKCPYFNECGGCQFQNIDINYENSYKTNKVKDLVTRIGHIYPDLVEDTKSINEFNYRNKVVFHVNNRVLGYYKNNSNEIVEVDNCLLLKDEINDLIPKIKEIVEIESNDIEEVMIRCSNKSSKVMVCFLGVVEDLLDLDTLVECIYINNELVFGYPLISEIGNYKFYVSPKSFFQVNDVLVEKLYDEVLDYCGLEEVSNVLDLYCGTGTIGIYISRAVENVLGIDISESSIEDANKNKVLNGVENCNFICSRVEDYIDKINGEYDLVVVDPPRAGLDNKTKDYLKTIGSKAIIYISCDPATLARDINDLSDTYEVMSVKPYNMFVKTYHVENVVVLERKN